MVVTVIAAMSLRGYCRTLIVFIACNPAMRMTKLTTIASTGRRIKRSVNDFMRKIRNPNFEILNKFESGKANQQRESQFPSLEYFQKLFRVSTFVLRHFFYE